MEAEKHPGSKADAAATAECSVRALWREQVPIHWFNYSWGLISQAAACLPAFPAGWDDTGSKRETWEEAEDNRAKAKKNEGLSVETTSDQQTLITFNFNP